MRGLNFYLPEYRTIFPLNSCGATVISTSRFPADAALRFSQQQDFAEWKNHIHCYGLDLRDLAAVEDFCTFLNQQYSRLDVIINNACQTVRRPAAYYRHLLEFERSASTCKRDGSSARSGDGLLMQGNEVQHRKLIAEGNNDFDSLDMAPSVSSLLQYQHQLRKFSHGAGSRGPSYEASQIQILPEDACILSVEADARKESHNSAVGANIVAAVAGDDSGNSTIAARSGGAGSLGVLPPNVYDINAQQLDLRKHNSWCMRMHEVSTPEIAEVMAINAIAPFVISARLKALMSKTAASALMEAGLQSDGDASNKYTEHRRDGRDYEGTGPHRTQKFAGSSCAGSGASSNTQSSSFVPRVHHSACVFIVNVSSMEGKFYRCASAAKSNFIEYAVLDCMLITIR